MVKSVLGAILTILSVPTLGMGVGNTVTVFTIWFAGGNYEIGQGMTASDYAKGLAYSFLALLVGCAMLWGGMSLFAGWRTALWITALFGGWGILREGISMSPEYTVRTGGIVSGVLMLLVGGSVLIANRVRARRQAGVSEDRES